MAKVLIADDQESIRGSIQIILEANLKFKVTATVTGDEEVLDAIKKERPDVILMDVRMPKMDGTVYTKYVKSRYPETKVITLAAFDDDDFIFSALKYGASGYLSKRVSNDQLYQAIETVHQGGAIINPNIAEKVSKLFFKMAQSNYAIQVGQIESKYFSKDEWRVTQQVGLGLSNKEISAKLYLSEGTVRNYISSTLNQLDLRNRTQLTIWVVQTGVTSRDSGE